MTHLSGNQLYDGINLHLKDIPEVTTVWFIKLCLAAQTGITGGS